MIRTSNELSLLIDRAKKAACVAIDTEFVWEQTYYPSLGIVQMGIPDEEPHIIDIPAIEDVSPLGEIISDPNIVKILHDAQQDLTILRRTTGSLPKNIFDTRCAAGFVGLSSSISLSALLHEGININLSKTETRTDWLQRPLTEKQISYAMDDVRYLPELYNVLLSKARELDRDSWLAEELAQYDNPHLYQDNDPQEQFRRVKGSGRMESMKMAILRELAAWREEEARRRNCPRLWILPDEVLLSLVKQKPSSTTNVSSLKELSEKNRQRYGKMILQAIEKGIATPQNERPKLQEHQKDPESLGPRVDLALAYMKGKSMNAGIDPALL
ncbi:MAG: ribonuclease D, partial [Chloroflexi bacterium]|nr:ribonuclease D [Chloroflexota bacterium]